MKRNKTLLLPLFLALLFGLGSCQNNGSSSLLSNEQDIHTLVNFTDSTVEQEIGSRYQPDITEVKNAAGHTFSLNQNLFITATDSQGNNVPITNGSFVVSDFGGYTVFYRVYSGKEFVERKVRVTVSDSTAPSITIYGWRKEREVGTFDLPSFYVSDNSGEALTPTYRIVDAATGEASSSVTVKDSKVTFLTPGTYKIIAEATDSKGNKGTAERSIIITPSMGERVLEDFADENHLETICNNNEYTSQTTCRWLSSFEGENGVAMIRPNYCERWYRSYFLQLSLPKSAEEVESYHWDNLVVRAYLSVGNEQSVTVANGTNSFGTYPTNQWVDITISRRDYLAPSNGNMLSLTGSESMDERYAAFAKGVTGATPNLFLSVNAASADSEVTIYLDRITWGTLGPDTVAPSVTLQGASWRMSSHSSMKLPTITVEDDRDPVQGYDSIHFYRQTDSGREEIAIKNGSVAIGDAGTYVLVVHVSDFSGNQADREFIFTALDNYDPHVIATYDNESQIGGVNGTTSWLDQFEGASGVMKTVVDNAVEYGAGFLNLRFSEDVINTAIQNRFDYLRFRLYVSAETSSSSIDLYSWNRSLGNVPLNTWVNFDVTIKDLSNGSFLSYGNQLTRQATYTRFLNEYVYNGNVFWYTNDNDLKNNRRPVTFYFDSLEWGVTYEKDFIVSIPGLSSTIDSSKEGGNRFAVPTTAMVSDGITSSEQSLTSFVLYRQGTDEVVSPTGSEYVLEDGTYTAVAKITGLDDFVLDFVVADMSNTVYAFSEQEYYTEAPTGVPYPAKGQPLQFDYHNGGSTWMASFKGADGKTEYGVQKANTKQQSLRFDVGNKPFTFDAIVIRAYFECSATSLRLSSFNSHAALGVATNSWVDVKIARSAIQTAGSAMYQNGANKDGITDDTVFYSDIFGIVGYNNQNAFNFNFYDQTDALCDVTVYLSRISYVPAA